MDGLLKASVSSDLFWHLIEGLLALLRIRKNDKMLGSDVGRHCWVLSGIRRGCHLFWFEGISFYEALLLRLGWSSKRLPQDGHINMQFGKLWGSLGSSAG